MKRLSYLSRRHFLAGIAALSTAAASPLAVAQTGAGKLRELKLGVFPIVDAAVLLLARDRGIFEKHGLKVTISTLSTASIVQSTMSGQVDVALNSLQHTASASAAGLPIGVVSGLSRWAKGSSGADPDGLIVRKGDVRSGADLNGKTIAVVALNSADELAARVTVDRFGGDARSLKFTVLPPPAMKGAVQNGDVQAAVVHDPFYSSFMASGAFAAPFGNPNFLAFADLPRLVLIASRDYAKANADTMRALRAAVAEAIAYAESHPQDVPEALMKGFNTPEADAKASALPKLSAEVTVPQVAQVKKLFEDYSFAKGTVDPSALVLAP